MPDISFVNAVGSINLQHIFDICVDDTFAYRASVVVEDGVQTLRLRRHDTGYLIASHAAEKGLPLNQDQVLEWFLAAARTELEKE